MAADPSPKSALEQRIVALESSVKRWKWSLASIGAVAASAVFMAAYPNKDAAFRTVTADTVNTNELRAKSHLIRSDPLSSEAYLLNDLGGLQVETDHLGNRFPMLALKTPNGYFGMDVDGPNPDEAPGRFDMSFMRHGQLRFLLSANADRSGFDLMDETGRTRARAGADTTGGTIWADDKDGLAH